MPDNRKRYGFRWSTAYNGSMPKPIEMPVADAYQATNDGAGFNVDLNIGDPVVPTAAGGVALALTTQVPYGIVVGILQLWDAVEGVVKSGDRVPGGTSGGGNLDRQTRVLVVPCKAGYWEVDADDAVTATTEAAYRALVGQNVEHVCPGDNSISARPKADPKIDISGAAVTATLGWRIVGVSKTQENRYWDGANVKMIVAVNESAEAGSAASASIVAGI